MAKPLALIVDNDPFYVELLADLLQREGYQILKAYDGLEALELLERVLPDLVLLDIVMPKVDGERVCQYLKGDPRTRAIPVVILSGLAVEDQAALLAMGADACLAKGNLQDIQEELRAILQGVKGGGSGSLEKIWGVDRIHPRTLVKELLAIRRHQEALLRTMREGVLDADAAGKITYINPAGLEILGLSEREVIGRSLLAFFGEEEQERLRKALEALPSSEKGKGLPLSSKERRLLVELVPTWEEGKFSGFFAILQDITPMVRQIQELSALNRKLQELDQLRADFLAMLTHNFRTPLAAIRCSLDVLAEEWKGHEFGRRMLEIAEENIARVNGLVDDLLDLSRIETGQLELHLEPVALVPLIQGVLKQVAGLARQKRIRLGLTVEGEIPPIPADHARLEQILLNLIGNALKFTPEGGEVQVEVTRVGAEILLTVADTGPGLKPEERERVFEKFYRGAGQEAGTGLGLYICKALVEGHGGRIWAEAEGGKGGRFSVALPTGQGKRLPVDTLHDRLKADGKKDAEGRQGMNRSGVHYLVVSRQCLHLYPELLQLFEGRSDVRIIIDRRQGERRKALQPVTEERRREDRRKGSHLLLI